jgi:hypothetical protein
MTQKAELTFEIEETVVLKQSGYLMTEYCPRCQEMVEMVSPDVLSLVNGVSEREIFRLVEIGEIHFIELGRMVVCPGCYRRMMANNPQFGTGLVLGRSTICENEEYST